MITWMNKTECLVKDHILLTMIQRLVLVRVFKLKSDKIKLQNQQISMVHLEQIKTIKLRIFSQQVQ